jgi:hypothetical protein
MRLFRIAEVPTASDILGIKDSINHGLDNLEKNIASLSTYTGKALEKLVEVLIVEGKATTYLVPSVPAEAEKFRSAVLAQMEELKTGIANTSSLDIPISTFIGGFLLSAAGFANSVRDVAAYLPSQQIALYTPDITGRTQEDLAGILQSINTYYGKLINLLSLAATGLQISPNNAKAAMDNLRNKRWLVVGDIQVGQGREPNPQRGPDGDEEEINRLVNTASQDPDALMVMIAKENELKASDSIRAAMSKHGPVVGQAIGSILDELIKSGAGGFKKINQLIGEDEQAIITFSALLIKDRVILETRDFGDMLNQAGIIINSENMETSLEAQTVAAFNDLRAIRLSSGLGINDDQMELLRLSLAKFMAATENSRNDDFIAAGRIFAPLFIQLIAYDKVKNKQLSEGNLKNVYRDMVKGQARSGASILGETFDFGVAKAGIESTVEYPIVTQSKIDLFLRAVAVQAERSAEVILIGHRYRSPSVMSTSRSKPGIAGKVVSIDADLSTYAGPKMPVSNDTNIILNELIYLAGQTPAHQSFDVRGAAIQELLGIYNPNAEILKKQPVKSLANDKTNSLVRGIVPVEFSNKKPDRIVLSVDPAIAINIGARIAQLIGSLEFSTTGDTDFFKKSANHDEVLAGVKEELKSFVVHTKCVKEKIQPAGSVASITTPFAETIARLAEIKAGRSKIIEIIKKFSPWVKTEELSAGIKDAANGEVEEGLSEHSARAKRVLRVLRGAGCERELSDAGTTSANFLILNSGLISILCSDLVYLYKTYFNLAGISSYSLIPNSSDRPTINDVWIVDLFFDKIMEKYNQISGLKQLPISRELLVDKVARNINSSVPLMFSSSEGASAKTKRVNPAGFGSQFTKAVGVLSREVLKDTELTGSRFSATSMDAVSGRNARDMIESLIVRTSDCAKLAEDREPLAPYKNMSFNKSSKIYGGQYVKYLNVAKNAGIALQQDLNSIVADGIGNASADAVNKIMDRLDAYITSLYNSLELLAALSSDSSGFKKFDAVGVETMMPTVAVVRKELENILKSVLIAKQRLKKQAE